MPRNLEIMGLNPEVYLHFFFFRFLLPLPSSLHQWSVPNQVPHGSSWFNGRLYQVNIWTRFYYISFKWDQKLMQDTICICIILILEVITLLYQSISRVQIPDVGKSGSNHDELIMSGLISRCSVRRRRWPSPELWWWRPTSCRPSPSGLRRSGMADRPTRGTLGTWSPRPWPLGTMRTRKDRLELVHTYFNLWELS